MAGLAVPVNGWVLVVVQGTLFGQETRNRFVYKNAGGAPENTDTIKTGFPGACWTALIAQCSNQFKSYQMHMVVYDATGAPIGSVDEPLVAAGGDASPSLPPSVSVVLRRKADGIGRITRGRVYMPGIAQADVTDGALNALAVTAWTTAATGLGNMIMAQFEPHVATFTTSGHLSSSRRITRTGVDAILRSQRRRELNVGI